MKCPKCGHQVSDTEKFCGKCGAEMPEYLYVCPKCFKGYNEERKFCGECGTELKSTAKAVNSSTEKPKELIKCPQCGAFNFEGTEKCTRCGNALSGQALEQQKEKTSKTKGIIAVIAAVITIPIIIVLIIGCVKDKEQRDTSKVGSFVVVTKPKTAADSTEAPTKATPTEKPTEKNTEKPTEKETEPPTEAIPREYSNALRSAEQYNKITPMSKAGLFEQLTSEYGEQYSEEAAQYAIDNLNADWKENACKRKKNPACY